MYSKISKGLTSILLSLMAWALFVFGLFSVVGVYTDVDTAHRVHDGLMGHPWSAWLGIGCILISMVLYYLMGYITISCKIKVE